MSLLAQLLVPDSPGKDPFWPQSARTLLEGVLLHVLYAEPQKTLAACYRFLCSPEIPIQQPFFEDPLRQAAARHPLPESERTVPDFRHWLDRAPAPPAKTKSSRRGEIDKLLNSEALLP